MVSYLFYYQLALVVLCPASVPQNTPVPPPIEPPEAIRAREVPQAFRCPVVAFVPLCRQDKHLTSSSQLRCLIWGVSRGRAIRRGSVLLQPCCAGLQTLEQCQDKRLDTGRGLLPIGGQHIQSPRHRVVSMGPVHHSNHPCACADLSHSMAGASAQTEKGHAMRCGSAARWDLCWG
jgi:hypothetical protein